MPDYAKVRDEVILALGDAARDGNKAIQDLDKFLDHKEISCPESWPAKIAHDLSKQGLGNAFFSPKQVSFHPSGACIAAADEIRENRTLTGKLRRVGRSDWIALAAFVVSIIALFKK